MKLYVIGSLRNPDIPTFSQSLRQLGIEVFDDWFAAGPEADDKWRDYEIARGRSYVEALEGLAAQHVFAFDRHHIADSDAVVLINPAGRSGYLELGWALGKGKPGYIVLDPTKEVRYDVMLQFATKVFANKEAFISWVGQSLVRA